MSPPDSGAERARLEALLLHERAKWAEGFERVAGVDEAGVAPLAGPVVAAACILPRDYRPAGVDDSKKLTAKRREALEVEIKLNAIAWAIGLAEVEEIDSINILQGRMLAMRRAVLELKTKPDFLLIDGDRLPKLELPREAIVGGDAKSLSIAAASILAKTHRDRMMVALAESYPGYGFEKHKGYPTPLHFEALERLGPSPIHRRSFAPVRELLEGTPRQLSLALE